MISGSSQKGRLAEIMELPDHPFFVAGQFHPELRSRPTRPHPLFRDFVGAAGGIPGRPHPGRRPDRRDRLSRGRMPEPTNARVSVRRPLPHGRLRDVARGRGVGVLRKHAASAIVPLTPNGDVVLVRQFRVPVRQELLEVPAGLLDIPGEDALTCAERELYEETGYRSRDTKFLGGLYLSAGDHG